MARGRGKEYKILSFLMKKKRLKSIIHGIMEGNQEITNLDHIRDSAASHFENLLTSNVAQSGTPDFPFQFSKILEEVDHNICSIPSEEDLRDTVFSIDKDSIAGPDGFSSAFYKVCWEFIARDIYDAVRDLFSGTPMPRRLKATTIVLIPKEALSSPFGTDLPLTKQLRLGRGGGLFQIHTGVKTRGSHLSNSFHPRNRSLLQRHGLPLYPYMFYQMKCVVKLSHLSYADDVIIFTNCKEVGLIRLMQFLRSYEDISGQKINYAKSAFISGKKASLIPQGIKSIIGFVMKALPITYLGAPLYKGHKRKSQFENLIDKVRIKISGWEHCHLSYGGRL
ncbi:UNVERIFIED_CONTAM: hypothetical protein Slati_3697700 [Sesamum latifolium]|uniref:Reverse transcriptase domain-containing protein n=1 Tax=Sesamum latifolium TaxID=2727402 RepID=A0AAW2U1H2_9LAMI